VPYLKFKGHQSLNGVMIPGINNSSMTLYVVFKGDSIVDGQSTGFFVIDDGTSLGYAKGFWFYRYRANSYQRIYVYNRNASMNVYVGAKPELPLQYFV
jgi:hypothetical protein